MDRNHMLATAPGRPPRRAWDAARPASVSAPDAGFTSDARVDTTTTTTTTAATTATTLAAAASSQLPPLHPHPPLHHHHHHGQALHPQLHQLHQHHQQQPQQQQRQHRHHLPVRPPPPNHPIRLPSPSPSPTNTAHAHANGPVAALAGPYSPMSMRSPPPPSPDPTARLPPLAHHDADHKMLPSLSSITGPQPPLRAADRPVEQPAPSMAPSAWSPSPAALNTTMPYRQSPQQSSRADSPATMDLDGSSSVVSANSPDRQHEGTPSSLTLDDPDVRLAAEALGDLRADFVSSPPDTSGPMSPPPTHGLQPGVPAQKKPARPEPLLSLLTTSHPLVASTIGGASSAYGGVKNYSPRFKSSAEYVEGYLTPIAKTVNRVGRRTGVEGGVRWFLGSGRTHEPPTSDPDSGNSKKRRKVAGDAADDKADDAAGSSDTAPPTPKSARRLSSTSTVDTLPAYDEQRSPAYTENTDGAVAPAHASAAQNHAWQTRLLMSTSGLSVAMSAESLRSLKYCLRWLRWTNDHMGKAIGSLKDALEEYESACSMQARAANGDAADDQAMRGINGTTSGAEGGSGTKTPEEARTEIANRIQVIKADILKTLQEVTNTVSKYAGGALPENARILVRRHLTSLPQRFRLATMSDGANARSGTVRDTDSSLRDGAQKVLVLAKEGLDMVTQISGVLDGTIVSAEDWCERMGKRRPSERDEYESLVLTEKPLPPPIEANGDVKMG